MYFDKSEISETGEYDLDGLFVRLEYAIKTTGAKRVVLDTIEALFSGLSNESIVRAELRRLFRWPGGKYLYCMRSPDGKDYWSTGTIREVVSQERLVLTDSFSDNQGNVVSAAYYGMNPDKAKSSSGSRRKTAK